MRALTIVIERRPWTLNVERQGNRWKRAALVADWRKEAALYARTRTASFTAVDIVAAPELRNRAAMPDTAACVGAAKAMIDGLVDAGVLPSDGPDVVRSLTFLAPRVTGRDALSITVNEAAA